VTAQTTSDILTVYDLYIGDGTYDTLLLDQSGNGNHGIVYGATPVDGGLSFDGVNDYVDLPSQVLPDIFSFSTAISSVVSASVDRIILNQGSGVNLFAIRHQVNTGNLRFIYNSGGVATGINATGFFETSQVYRLSFTLNWAANTITVYRDGVLFVTLTLTNAIKPTNATIRLGASSNGLQGTIRNPRIYNRALSAAEIYALANNPDAYNLDRTVKAVTPVPNSIPVRDSNGSLRLLSLTTTQRDAITSPPEGMLIYNTTTKVLNFYNGTSWGAV
jgi:hypothetical protein